jgi:flagellar hook-associated protein 1 FlgK
MGLSGLDTALSGLRTAQQQLDIIANNVSNVSTPGYTRKILPQATVVVDGSSAGVRGMPVTRYVDMDLARDMWTQVSATEFYDVQASYLSRIQEFHGPPDSEVSVAAEIGELRDTFSALADSPEDNALQRNVVNQAQAVANKINDFADLISEMRNDAQEDMSLAIQSINGLLNTISDVNKQIRFNEAIGKTSAALKDTRDQAVGDLAKLMDISFFTRGDGVLVVQTKQGVQLADENAETLYFEDGALGPTSFYPQDAHGIFVGDPDSNPNAIEITNTGIGGQLGAYVELRDDILPRQQAQLDEMAQKLAMRFDSQGLRLFTDATGNVPANDDPVIAPPADPIPVPYVGFSSSIRVNPAVVADNTLVQQGTAANDTTIQSGSNEVIRRVIQFTFGEINYQEAQAATGYDIRAAATGGTTLQDWLGIYSQNEVKGAHDLTGYSDLDALMDVDQNVFSPPLNDTFQLTFEEARTGSGPATINISLSAAAANYPVDGVTIHNAAEQLAAEINNQIGLVVTPAAPELAASASVNSYGQLVINSRGSITADGSFSGGMGDEGLAILGLTEGTSVPTDPYIDIKVGNNPAVRVTIEPGDTETEFLDKLEYDAGTGTGVPGLYVDMDANGLLYLRPGGDDSNSGPVFGGDLTITGGPFATDGTGAAPQAATAGLSILSAVFGSNSPVGNVAHDAFRNENLGQGANIATGIISSTNLVDFGQKMVNRQTEEANTATAQQSDSQTFRDLLQSRMLDESGVNIEEELSNMIVMQTAFSAAAKVVTTIDEMFRDLLNAV